MCVESLQLTEIDQINRELLYPAQVDRGQVGTPLDDETGRSLLAANYDRAETILREAGFTEIRKSKRFVPAIWQSESGDLRLALVRMLGSEFWRGVRTYELSDDEEAKHVDLS